MVVENVQNLFILLRKIKILRNENIIFNLKDSWKF